MGKVDISCVAGWLRGRQAFIDDATGSIRTVPGLEWRVRLDTVIAYSADEPGVVVIWCKTNEQGISMIGSVETLDKIMERAQLREVEKR